MTTYVDLGLPSGTLWADRNVEAENPQDFGGYFNFEDAQKYGILPNKLQMCELIDCTTQEICKVNGIRCIRLIGKNGNKIIAPFAGYQYDCYSRFFGVVPHSFWWSCTPEGYHAYALRLNASGRVYLSDYGDIRSIGYSVRLIKNK